MKWHKVISDEYQEGYVFTSNEKPTEDTKASTWLMVRYAGYTSKVTAKLVLSPEPIDWDEMTANPKVPTYFYRGNFIGMDRPNDPLRRWVNQHVETPLQCLQELL